mmetsp:Transcript_126126/g.315208  ORF Transcript_126126/g.315208 Transcript_126126/m.315208 type:complete len:639 (+) Transcript_126126:77-1993(+)
MAPLPQDLRALRDRLVFAAAAGGAVVVAGSWLRRWQWRARRHAGKAHAPTLPTDADILRVGFSAKKLPAEIDHVIIGSGLSGLYLASLLAKIGRRVVVLEQHYVAGGCTHTFKDKGFEFDTGVHYMGMATIFTAFMDFAAGQRGTFRMQRQGADDGSEVYNELHAGGSCLHRFRPGPRTFVNDLIAKFPQEEKSIRRFFRAVLISGAAMVLVATKQFMPAAVWKALLQIPGPVRYVVDRYIHRTLAEALTDCGVQNLTLRSILSAEFGDHGMVPEKAPFFLHAGILNHYMEEGGFAPVGGSDSFALALVPSILEAGGAVLVRAPVARIVEENGRVVGVEMGNGKGIVRAKQSVISSTGVEVTYRKLLDECTVQKMGGPPASLVSSEEKGVSHHMYGFVGFEGDSEDLGLPTYNIWSLMNSGNKEGCCDISAAWAGLFGPSARQRPDFLSSDDAAATAQIPAFISFPSAKDATYKDRCPGKSTAVLITESRAEYFGEAGPVNKRSAEYATIKQRYERVLLNALYRHFPHLKGKVSYIDIGTPLSNEHYLGRASSYGLDQDADRFVDPTLRVSVLGMPGLFLTGQDVLCGGIFPQVISALLTLGKVLGPTSPDLWLLLSDFACSVGRRYLLDKTYAPTNP